MAHLNPLNPSSTYISVLSADMTAAQVNDQLQQDRRGASNYLSLGTVAGITGDTNADRVFHANIGSNYMPTRFK